MPSPESPILFSIEEVAGYLIKMVGHREGLFDLSVEFNLGVGNFGPTPEKVFPSAFVGISRIGLQKTRVAGPHTVDAAKVNPGGKVRKKP